MAFTFDFTNYRDTGSARVEPGTYRAQVTDFSEKESKAGNVMFEVYLEIIEGPYTGKQIIDRLPQTERAMFRSAAFLQALGIKIAKKKLALNPKSRQVDTLVEDGEPYNGRVKSEVREYLRATKPAKAAEPELPEDDEPAKAAEPAPTDTADDTDFDVDAIDIDDLDL